MEQANYDDKIFEKIDYTGNTIRAIEFQTCTFKNCNFSNSNFLNCKFLDCTFQDSNLSMMKLAGSILNDVTFRNCKILGVIFSECQDFLFSAAFEACVMDYASFMGKKMLKTRFIKSSLKEVNFSKSNLSGSVFDQSDLSGTVFNDTDLSAVNFVSAYNYTIEPELNNIKKATFSVNGLSGLLTKYQIKIV